jgi:predicted aspartyl protease
MTKPVPFKLAKPDKPLILLEAMVNGQGPFRFVLDTGAGLTILSPDLAARLKVVKGETKEGLGAGGGVEVHFGSVQSLALSEVRLQDLQVGIMNLSAISQACGIDLDGIIGYNFLKEFRVLIDYPRQTVTFEMHTPTATAH